MAVFKRREPWQAKTVDHRSAGEMSSGARMDSTGSVQPRLDVAGTCTRSPTPFTAAPNVLRIIIKRAFRVYFATNIAVVTEKEQTTTSKPYRSMSQTTETPTDEYDDGGGGDEEPGAGPGDYGEEYTDETNNSYDPTVQK